MSQFYSVMLMLAGLLLIVKAAKESKIFIVAGGYFLGLGAWRMADSFVEPNLFEGTYGMAVKIVTAAVLGVIIVYFALRYIKEYKTGKQPPKEPESKEKEGD